MKKQKEENPIKALAEEIFGGVKTRRNLIIFFQSYLSTVLKRF
jgi:hypothetical protein